MKKKCYGGCGKKGGQGTVKGKTWPGGFVIENHVFPVGLGRGAKRCQLSEIVEEVL